ncbi:nucleotide exchange factor GrpE [Methylobacterium nodulans]|uniref:Protein GrpE n=1 Tax=Methylobacterium nodulans (strain LMG 21967 / CNCM I-2342 / ORS 2060) TaxID=460265 RepID=GRPE_METNO|nr:nucleotide exchange factor GrpE [Methylobacterium nodulans]B8IJD7.1 RecName: Full=Protein GrpE; AltName: Full=HSP-70 cofactor [Methylobacterium nodulans ORS 2060]ACL56152.1 GrpE protein [Methylobacterium nodulans ORS 2060]
MTPNDTENAARPLPEGAVDPAQDAAGAPDTLAPAAQADAVAALEAEKLDLKNKLLRALADMENLRRRTEREVADARTYAVTNFARDMLNVADNVRRALDSVPVEDRAAADGALKALLDGIELTGRDLAKTLERHGVRAVEPQGQRFDPNLHQAMFEVPNPDVANGTVVQVVQTGYVIGDRVLRPALVGVSKGGPKAAEASKPAGEAPKPAGEAPKPAGDGQKPAEA